MTLAGLRVEASHNPPDMSSGGVISVLQDREATLRLFGAGLTDGLRVKFTGERLEKGASCEQSQTTVAFEVRPPDRDTGRRRRDGRDCLLTSDQRCAGLRSRLDFLPLY